MTDTEYDLLNEMGFHCERLACLSALLEVFDSTAPFSFSCSGPDAQREESLYSLRLFTCICDLARHYSDEFCKALSSIQI